jgi:PadR family transcriptional regulator, regulatory protein PadR
MAASNIGEFEELVLRAILKLKDEAYGVPIREVLEDATERNITVGALYTTLDRLEAKGFVTSWQGDPTPERGGRARRYFKVTGAGANALREADRIRRKLVPRLEGALGGM